MTTPPPQNDMDRGAMAVLDLLARSIEYAVGEESYEENAESIRAAIATDGLAEVIARQRDSEIDFIPDDERDEFPEHLAALAADVPKTVWKPTLTPAEPTPVHYPACNDQCIHYLVGEYYDYLTTSEQHRLACGTCGQRLRDHIEGGGVTGHCFVRTFAPDPAPLDVERLARAMATESVRRWVHEAWVDSGVSEPGYATPDEMAEAIAREYAKDPQP